MCRRPSLSTWLAGQLAVNERPCALFSIVESPVWENEVKTLGKAFNGSEQTVSRADRPPHRVTALHATEQEGTAYCHPQFNRVPAIGFARLMHDTLVKRR